MRENTHDLLVRGVAAAKAGDTEEARFFLEWILRLDPPKDERIDAWFWLSEISRDISIRRKYLEEILANDPGEPRARRSLAILDGRLNPVEVIDPNQFRQPVPNEAQKSTGQAFICSKCGGRLTYSSDGRALICEYCDYRQRIDAEQSGIGQDFLVTLATARGHSHPVVIRTIECRGCGAEFLFSPQQISAVCPYCETPYTIKEARSKEILTPDVIIPFRISSRSARNGLVGWLERHFPDKGYQLLPETGIYLPIWLFNIGGTLAWRGTIEHDSKKIKVPTEGSKIILNENIMVLATNRLKPALHQGLWKFDLAGLVSYNEAYLSGWQAETYSIPAANASLQARQYVFEIEQKQTRLELPAALTNVHFSSARMIVDSYRLGLFPVWLAQVHWEGSIYHILVNGQNGYIVGEKPDQGIGMWVNRIFDNE